MSGCFWFQSQKWAPSKRAAGLVEELPCFWNHAIKMMALEAPLPQQPQSKNQSNLHHITQFANEWTDPSLER